MNNAVRPIDRLHASMITTVAAKHFGQAPRFIERMTQGICNEVYCVGLGDKEVIIRLNTQAKYLMGSHDHIPKFKALDIKVPDILFEDYNKILIPFAYQIQTKIEGHDLGEVIETLTDLQLRQLAKEIAMLFNKVKTIPASQQFGLIWGGGDNDLSNTWTERMYLWIEESKEHGRKTGVMDDGIARLADKLYQRYQPYFDSVIPVTYCGDISSKNVMIQNGVFNGLVDLDGLTQGDPLEAIGRIKLCWYGTTYGQVYTEAIMNELQLNEQQRHYVALYTLLNQIAWMCENGIQFNQNTKPIVDQNKLERDKAIVQAIATEMNLPI